jgi:glycosyltransferase involved in cell wall biosynthesis
MKLEQITPVLLTLDEAPNIGRTLSALQWARRIIVLDSGSTDATASIVASFPNAELHRRTFDSHAQQWNHALTLTTTDWVLTLDADYLVNESLPAELLQLDAKHACVWYAPFDYWVAGKAVRGAILPPRAVLFRPQDAHYVDDGHTQLLQHDAPAARLRSCIAHDDRKPLSRWLRSQIRYAELEAAKLVHSSAAGLNFADRVRQWVWLAPVLVFLHVYLVRGAVFSGWRGWFYAGQRALAELILSLYLAERRIGPSDRRAP